MIIDHIKNFEQYGFVHQDMDKIYEVLKTLTSSSDLGKRILEEGNLWVDVREGRERTEKAEFEAHENFLDIHYIVSGKEEFGYANIEGLSVTKPYNPEKDVVFYEDNGISAILDEGYFCVVFPQDAHIPFKKKLGDNPLIRAVAKLRIK